jgi:glycosyltransferase involved in cell wall biosynthesis
MRLAVEVSTCSAERTGIGYYTEHFVDALIATQAPGDDIVLISNGKPAPELYERWRDQLRIGGVPVRAIWMQRDVNRLLLDNGADFAVFPNYLAPLHVARPFVNVVHDLAIIRTPEFFNLGKLAIQRPLLPLVVRRAAAVGTVSAASRRDITELLGVPEHRVLMLPGAPHPACRVPPASEIERVRRAYGLSRRYVVSVGTLEPRKNLPTLLRAFDRLRARAGTPTADLDLVVIGGRGWRDRELRAELATRLESGRLHTLGYVPEKDLVALYGGAEVLAYPSHFEGFGLPVVEAMACGTPVVTTDVPALREVSGDAAILVPLGDEGALADAVADVVCNPETRAAARARGLARAATFSWESSAQTLWRFARETVAARSHWVARWEGKGRTGESNRANGASATSPSAITRPSAPAPGPAPTAGEDADWAILATVVYADLFEAPISVEEVARTCLGARLSEAEVRARVAAAPLAELLTLDATGILTLRGREHLVAVREDGARRTAELLERHHGVIGALASLPFVRMLALSGGTAHKNARGGDDIDLFVVATAGRAYTAYTMLFLASTFTRRRGILCPNYLVDENHLRIAYHHDLFTAHQAISLVPIAGLETFDAFVRANESWVRGFYPAYLPRPPGATLASSPLQRVAETVLGWSLGDEIERLLSVGWRFHLGRRAASAPRPDLVLDAGILKLHLSDHRRRVLDKFAGRLRAYRDRWSAPEAAP